MPSLSSMYRPSSTGAFGYNAPRSLTVDSDIEVRKEQEILSDQLANGTKYQNFSDIPQQMIHAHVNNLKDIAYKSMATSNHSAEYDKLDQITVQLEEVQDIINETKNILNDADLQSDQNRSDKFLRNQLDRLEGVLNTKFDGQYLFGGHKTNQPVVGDLQVSNIDATGIITDNYVLNIPHQSTYEVDGNHILIKDSIPANHELFKNLIGAIHLGLSGSEHRDKALELLEGCNKNLNNLDKQNNESKQILEKKNESLEQIIDKSAGEFINKFGLDIKEHGMQAKKLETLMRTRDIFDFMEINMKRKSIEQIGG